MLQIRLERHRYWAISCGVAPHLDVISTKGKDLVFKAE